MSAVSINPAAMMTSYRSGITQLLPRYWKRLGLFALTLVAASLFCSDAKACLGAEFEQTVFFDEVPVGIDAPVIVEVAITDVSTTSEKYYWVGFSHVKRVIKGPNLGKTLKVLILPTSCTRGFGAGESGIVAGTLRQDAQGAPELIAIAQSQHERRRK